MMPYALLCGGSGSGKDTVAAILRERFGAPALAMSDPMKRFALRVLGFPVGLLWGESSLRNSLDTRFAHQNAEAWNVLARELNDVRTFEWLDSISFGQQAHPHRMRDGLREWQRGLLSYAKEHGGLTPRFALQTIGTEFGRKIVGDDTWVDFALRQCREVAMGKMYHAAEGFVGQTAPAPFVVVTDGRFPNEVLRVKEFGGVAILIECENSNTEAAQSAGVAGHASEKSLASIPFEWYDAVIANDKRSGLDALANTVVGCFSALCGGRGRVPVYTPEVVQTTGRRARRSERGSDRRR